jgi:hypothetical protein
MLKKNRKGNENAERMPSPLDNLHRGIMLPAPT